MSTLHSRIKDFDYDTASISELVTLLEQIFTNHDPRVRDGGPFVVAIGVLTKFEESVRRRAAPELHDKVKGRTSELRSTVTQLSDLLRKLERDSAQASP